MSNAPAMGGIPELARARAPTILLLQGIDHKRSTYPYSGRDLRLTDVEGKVINDILV
jgi:hypothetical protein